MWPDGFSCLAGAVPVRHWSCARCPNSQRQEHRLLRRRGQRARIATARSAVELQDTTSSEMAESEQEALNKLVEVLADRDNALLEKVLEDVEPRSRRQGPAGSVIGSAGRGGPARMACAGSGKRCVTTRHSARTHRATRTARHSPRYSSGACRPHRQVYARIWRGPVTLGGGPLQQLHLPRHGWRVWRSAQKLVMEELVALGRLEARRDGAAAAAAVPGPPTPVSMAIFTTDPDDVKLSARCGATRGG